MALSQNHRLMELFDAAVDLPRDEQVKFLAELKPSNAGLRSQLDALLAVDQESVDYRLKIADVARPLRSGHADSSGHCAALWLAADSNVAAASSGAAILTRQTTLPEPGTELCQYEIIRELGRGGMGAVYLARDTKLSRRVAIKFLLSNNRHMTARFVMEARATAQCMHENIVIIYEVNEHREHPFMVLEYIKGQSLCQVIKGQPLAPRRAVEIMVAVLRALACAHEMGIVHRDLKPENIMLTDAGTVKVLDFGIAKILAGGRHVGTNLDATNEPSTRFERLRRTSTGALIGTLPYMSPEQFGSSAIDHRTDIWAVGIMLCEMVTGLHPLAPLSLSKLMEITELDRPMPRMSEFAPHLGELGPIIDRCLIKHKDHRTATARELLVELESLLSPTRVHQNLDDQKPFLGLTAFQEADADRFFGRDSDIASMVAQLRHKPLLTLVGPSGTGKSSLVRAGVIPAIKRSGEGWDSLVMRPGRRPVAALASTLLQVVLRSGHAASGDVERVADRDALAGRLLTEPGYLGKQLRAHANREQRRLMLFVDQFEELYTLGADTQERAAFVACLEGVADDTASPLRVVLSMRSDFLDRVAEDRKFMSEVTRGLVLLPQLGRDGLREALTRPVKATGYEFENPELVETMLDSFDTTRGALPLLQFTAAKLWDSRDRANRLLTRASYDEIGGIGGTLADHADAVLCGMTPPRLALARAVFERLVTPARTRAIATMDELRELPGDPNAIERVIHDLAKARLVTITTGGGSEGISVELIHESLIGDWPTLQRWLDANQDDAAFLARLRVAAKQWDQDGRREGMLWRDEAEREARHWRQRYRGELPERERAYIEAVFALADRMVLRRRFAVGVVMTFLIISLAVALVALVSIHNAEQLANEQAQELREEKAEAVRARIDAEYARRVARSAQRRAVVEAERARVSAIKARNAEAKARVLQKQTMKQKIEADRARKEAVNETARAVAAEEEALREKAKAERAAAQAKRSEDEKQNLIDVAVGSIRRELPP